MVVISIDREQRRGFIHKIGVGGWDTREAARIMGRTLRKSLTGASGSYGYWRDGVAVSGLLPRKVRRMNERVAIIRKVITTTLQRGKDE